MLNVNIFCTMLTFYLFSQIDTHLIFPNDMRFSTVFEFSLFINLQIQTSFLATYLKAIYYALVVEMETVLYFLLLHDTTALFKKKQYLIFDFQLAKFPAKLLLAYPGKPYRAGSIIIYPYIKPNYIVSFKYQTTFFADLR